MALSSMMDILGSGASEIQTERKGDLLHVAADMGGRFAIAHVYTPTYMYGVHTSMIVMICQTHVPATCYLLPDIAIARPSYALSLNGLNASGKRNAERTH